MYFLNPLSKLRLHEFIGTKMSRISCSSIITTAHYTYPNFLNKNINIFWMQIPNYSIYPFGFYWCKWRFNHSEWWCYAFKSSSCTSKRERAWRNTTWHECFLTATRRKTIQKSGAHPSQSFNMRLSIVF